ncbi:MAG: hypothetical protein M3383_01245 [Actinomycetota bacterium]|nr:hypothetical protein [Actinomycetota bacterium]
MTDHAEIEEILAKVERGLEVEIITHDGRKVRGTYGGLAEDRRFTIVNADAPGETQLAVSDVAEVRIVIRMPEGPE